MTSHRTLGGLGFGVRPSANGTSDGWDVLPDAALRLPMTLRLTRRGDTITGQYSRDGGKSFQPADEPYRFEPALPKTIYAGLAITSRDVSQISEAKFSDLQIQQP